MSKLTTNISRGNILESSHEVKCLLGYVNGEVIFSTNNENDLIYPRSSIKVFQGIPFFTSQAVELYNLNKKQIALSCSSHCGEDFHVEELKNWLKKINLKISDLKCGIHNPIHQKSSNKLYLSGEKPNQIHNNCAGKHLAMLTSCIVNNFPIKNYVDFNHPHQISIRKIFSKFTENIISRKNYGIDGCSAPQYAFTIEHIGKALSNLLNSYNGKFEYSENIQLIINAVLTNPKFIGGSNNLDSNLIKISNKNIFCKGGAEGVFLFTHLKKRIFGILKVKDGNERALPSAVYTLLKKFKIISKEELSEFISWNKTDLYNHAKITVGRIESIIG
ncbi:asparaginase [Alphaproteobacteria bacterium]|nr:asparaginase [Alphaproteobacteria bacterium]